MLNLTTTEKLKSRTLIPAVYPKLPCYEEIACYLKDIDYNRWYCNFGPLVKQFEQAIGKLFNLQPTNVISMASGTSALTAVLKTYFGNERGMCLVPGWTFSGTVSAVQMTQLTPFLCDVNESNWALDINLAERLCRENPDIRSVIVVSPFGAPLPYAKWYAFQEKLGVKVIIDAAGAFDSLSQLQNNTYELPTVISLHATKPFGVGEGGLVLTQDSVFAQQLREVSNFGFDANKQSTAVGLNAKMSEYHAAVGLSILDKWSIIRQDYLHVLKHYLRALIHCPVTMQNEETWFSSTLNIRLKAALAEQCVEYLSRKNVDARLWWRGGLHTQAAFTTLPRTSLTHCERLANSVVGLPFYRDMSRDDIDYVVHTLFSFLR